MEKNPFSLFDFLGYYIPGAFALFLFYFLQNEDGLLFYFYAQNVPQLNMEISIVYITFFIILSYTLGHVLSFLSTLTIENFTVWRFGYPSKNLLGVFRTEKYFERKKSHNNPNNIDWRITSLSFVLRLSLLIFLAPISILSYILGEILNLNYSIYKKSLGQPYIDLIKTKIEKVFRDLNSNLSIDFTNHDYNKLLIHHSYNINVPHQPKLMNYVALYGFLRVICFIFNLLSVFVLVQIFYRFKNDFYLYDFKETLFLDISIFVSASFMAYFSYLGYLKFYRRYTQENLMILLLPLKP